MFDRLFYRFSICTPFKILLPTIYLVYNWSDSTYQKFDKDAGRLY